MHLRPQSSKRRISLKTFRLKKVRAALQALTALITSSCLQLLAATCVAVAADAEAQEGMKKEQEELPLWAADWDDSETTDFAARLKEELKRSQPAGGGGK